MTRLLFSLLAVVLVVRAEPEITNSANLPDARVGSPYLERIEVENGRPPYRFDLTDGALPPGIDLVRIGSGIINGVPLASGDYNFRIRVTDSRNESGQKRFRLRVIGSPSSAPLTVTTGSLASGTVGVSYSEQLTASGGVPPYRWAAAGNVPQGVVLDQSGSLSGTPVVAGTHDFTVQVRDSTDASAQKPLRIVINPAPLAVTTSVLPNATAGQPYSATLTASGGASPYTWSIAGGTLPGGLSLSASGALAGTPSAQGTFDFAARVRDSAGTAATNALRIVVAPGATVVTTTDLPQGTAGQSYSARLQATGGTPPYTWAVTAGALPSGLNLSSSGTISGTPSTAGSSDFSVRANDSAPQALRIIVRAAEAPPVSITTAALPEARVGDSYSASLSATGGTPPYTWTVTAGALPSGLNLSPAGLLSGNPTASGAFDFTVRAADSGDRSATRALRISVNAAQAAPVTILSAGLASATVGRAYSQTLAANGGAPPYTWSITSGTLPPGLTLNPSGSITGTPTTPGESSFNVQATDTANSSGTRTLRIIVAPAAVPFSISTGTLPPATVGQAYSQTLSASGGQPPYQWTVASGSLPPGLTLPVSGQLTGTPTAPGDFDFVVRAADSAGNTANRQLRISVASGEPPLSITTSVLPTGNANTAYAHTLTASGGRLPYSWSVISGSVPPGLRIEAGSGQLTGTPLAGGQYLFTARVTDAAARTADRAFRIEIAARLSIADCPIGTARTGVPYTASVSAVGGLPPYQWSLTSGQLPPGTGLNPFSGALSGAPTAAGTFTFGLTVSDGLNTTASQSCTISVASSLAILTSNLPDATTAAPYSQNLQASGGVPPYRWTTSAGSLPPGLVLNDTGAIAGQAAQPGRFTFTVGLADSVGERTQQTYSVSVVAGLTIPACPNPVATAGQPYSSRLGAVGGQAPYTWSVANGTLPQGLSLSSDIVGGDPGSAGAIEFTLRVTDASGGSATRVCTISVAPQLRILTTGFEAAKLSATYRHSLVAEGGTPPYIWSLANGSLAPGLTLNSASGEVLGVPAVAGTYRFTVRLTDAAGVRVEQSYDAIVAAGLVITACPLPSAAVDEPYSSGLSLIGADGAVKWTITGGSLPAGMGLVAESGVITGVPDATGAAEFIVTATDAKPESASRTCAITVVPAALRVTGPETLVDAIIGAPYEAALSAGGGRLPYRWAIADGTLPAGIVLGADGILRGTPEALGTYRFTTRVEDEGKAAGTRSFEIRVVAARAPLVSFSDLPEILPPAQQPRIRPTLDSAYPAPLRGRVSLSFRPDPGLEDDPSIRFVTGDRFADFEVAADSTDPVFSVPQMALQTGSVAGTIELTVRLWSGDTEVTSSSMPVRALRVDRTAPLITNVRLSPVAGGVEVVVTGISTTREVTGATFQFTAAPGSQLDSSQVTVDTGAAARQWFADRRSVEFGGQFTFVQPFTIVGATLSEVTVTLTNAQGTSQPARARF